MPARDREEDVVEHRLVADLPRMLTGYADHVLGGSHNRAAKVLKGALASQEEASCTATLSADFRAECANKAAVLAAPHEDDHAEWLDAVLAPDFGKFEKSC